MKLLNITLVNIKRFIKTPQVIGVILVQAVFMFMFGGGSGSVDNIGHIGVINKDSGSYSVELIDYLKNNYNVNILKNEEGLDDNYVVVKINEGYSEDLKNKIKPQVEIKGVENDGIVFSAINDVEKFNNEKLKGSLIENYNENLFAFRNKENTQNNNPMMFLMLCYFMLVGGAMISEDTVKLKQGNVLKRSLTTSNSPYTIIGGLFLGMLILQGGITSIIFLLTSKTIDYGLNTSSAIAIIFAFSALSTSICLFTTRVAKNQTLASMIGIMYAVVAFLFMFLDMFSMAGDGIISKISMLLPFYWVLNITEGGSWLVSIGMILLMSGIFFTAGGFRYKNFINKI